MDKKGAPKLQQPQQQPRQQSGYLTLDPKTINQIANQSAQYQIPMLMPGHMIPAITQAMTGGAQPQPLALPPPNPQPQGAQTAPTVSNNMIVVQLSLIHI